MVTGLQIIFIGPENLHLAWHLPTMPTFTACYALGVSHVSPDDVVHRQGGT